MTNLQQRSYHVIIPAAGSGQRLGATLPKQYIKIAGKAVLRHTLDNVMLWPGLKSLRVIINPEHSDLYHEAVFGLSLAEPVEGGNERKDSINNAINNLSNVSDEDIVLVHDAARPFVQWKNVEALLEAVEVNDAATLGVPVSDTLRLQDDHTDLNRDSVYAVQTPQAMRYRDFKAAHNQADLAKVYTDDMSLARDIGLETVMVPGHTTNFKITTQDDLKMAKVLLLQNIQTRTGTGFDVHAFETESSSRKLMLCGIEVEHEVALSGHSDADVGLHAITDALLGALGAGDIGQHFPPSDDTFKDMDSALFLGKAKDILDGRDGSVENIDVTLICERPKIGPYASRMKARVAEILKIDEAQVNIKATTTERLGFAGRGEGIAAQAIATIKVPVHD